MAPQNSMFDAILAALLGEELDSAALPLPGKVPSLAACALYEAEALHVCHLQERAIARACSTVRPGKPS